MGAQPPYFKYLTTVNSVTKEVFFLPQGWEKNSTVSYKRDAKYFGMIRTWGLPLEFVEDGAKILRSAYYQNGVEAGVIMEVHQLINATYAYEVAFRGDIDFSEVDDQKDKFIVTLMQDGPDAKIKAYDSLKYEFPLVGDDIVNMILPGVVFTEKAESLFTFSTGPVNRYIPGSSIITGSFQSGFVTSQNTEQQTVTDTSFSSSDNWFLKANRNQQVRISGYLKGNYLLVTGGPGFSILIKDNTNATIRTLHSHSGGGAGSYEFSFDETIDLVEDQALFFYLRTNGTGGNTLTIIEGQFSSSYTSQSDPSPCKGIKPEALFKRIIKRISPGTPVSSSLLRNTWGNLIFTSGNGIREVPNAKIKISLDEFFQTMKSLDDTAMGIENGTVVMELSTYFARNVQAVDVGEVSDCSIKPAKAYMASKIKAGYDDGNTEDKNGVYEYNSGQQWELPISRLQNELNWRSVARADQFGIEKMRVEFNVTKTRSTDDTSSDNDAFMVDCYLDGELYRPILGSSYQSVTGLPSDAAANTAYNLAITPKKNLLRHGAYLRSIMDKMDNYYVNFGSAEKNADLRTVINSVGVKENESILVASLPEKYFIPHIATIKCKLPFGARRLFDTNPFGYVSFIWKDVKLKGYILEASVDIARNVEQEFQLLLTPDNNLLKLK